jgi:CheY-like chemotaxis protein
MNAPARPTVLVVEDELLVRLLANEVLEDAGYRVIEARDGQEALAILGLQPNIRLLLTDIMMPSLDGYSLSKIAAERWPDLRIILTSALPPPGELPANARYLPKPYRPQALAEAVQEALAHREAGSSPPIS